MGAFDEMLSAWRSNPDAEHTIALCSYLGATRSEDLIREVGARAEAWHQEDGEVMLAVGRMYLDADLLSEAQAALVSAGKASGRDARAFRYLGEVLLRRGDAVRSERVLARALELGQHDADTRLWHDRAVVYAALQKRAGTGAVATEVMRTLPSRRAPPPPVVHPGSYPEDEPTHRSIPVKSLLNPAAAFANGLGGALALEGPTGRMHLDAPTARRRVEPPPPPLRPSPEPLPAFELSQPSQPSATNGSAHGYPPRTPAGGLTAPLGFSTGPGQAFSAPPLHDPVPMGSRTAELRSYEDVTEVDDLYVDAPYPEPAIVLENLARVGLFEPHGGAPPAWERAAPTRSRGAWVLALATVMVIGAGVGAYKYTSDLKAERMVQAQRLTDEITGMLHSGGVPELNASDERLSRAFELDSRSQRAGRLWLENRVLGALLLPGESHGIDSAVHRALSVGLGEEDVAFGRIASFLVEGDLAGAAALLPKWDSRSAKDPFYQLAAGAALEAAGDRRALERYEAARSLDAKLVPADLLLARLTLVELGAEKGRPIVDALAQKIGDAPATRALRALLWAVEPERSKEPPPNAVLGPDDAAKLQAPLRFVPHVVEALQAIDAGENDKASAAIALGISSADSPATASWLGFLAIQAGDVQLARRGALRALEKAAVYPRARVLAARVALLGGRLDEAKKAIEELEPTAPEVAVVRAVVGYETLDLTELESAVQAFGDAKARADYGGLGAAPGVLSGAAYPKPDVIDHISRPQVPWGELVATDTALDTGNLALAERLMKTWKKDGAPPVYVLRTARLRRYQGKAEEAVQLSVTALEQGTTTARALIETVYDLLDKGDAAAARQLVAKYPMLLGPMTAWLRALVDVAADRKAEAAVKVAQLELPPDAAPILLRVLVARALAASGDKRAPAYLRALARRAGRNPDFFAAAKAAG